MKTMTKDELTEWLKTVKRVYSDSTFERDTDTVVAHNIYEDSEGNLFQVDFFPSGFNKSEPMTLWTGNGYSKTEYYPVPVKSVVTTHTVIKTTFEPLDTTKPHPYAVISQEEWL